MGILEDNPKQKRDQSYSRTKIQKKKLKVPAASRSKIALRTLLTAGTLTFSLLWRINLDTLLYGYNLLGSERFGFIEVFGVASDLSTLWKAVLKYTKRRQWQKLNAEKRSTSRGTPPLTRFSYTTVFYLTWFLSQNLFILRGFQRNFRQFFCQPTVEGTATRVSRMGSRPGDPEVGPRRFRGRGRSGLTL